MPANREHWDAIFTAKAADRVSWFRPHLDESLRFVAAARLAPTDAIIDVGGGASTFVDDLLDRGYTNLVVLDLSATAIDVARRRLGARADVVKWVCADITTVELPERALAFWHDRAVFHFLTDPADRTRYVDVVRRSVRPGGHVVVATFGPHGPEQCSGLDVARFSSDQIHAEFGDDFEKVGTATETHVTPWGSEQEFAYCYCRVAALGDAAHPAE